MLDAEMCSYKVLPNGIDLKHKWKTANGEEIKISIL